MRLVAHYAVMRLYRMDAAAAVLRDAARMAESIKADGLPSP
jgi:hypothetical protein